MSMFPGISNLNPSSLWASMKSSSDQQQASNRAAHSQAMQALVAAYLRKKAEEEANATREKIASQQMASDMIRSMTGIATDTINRSKDLKSRREEAALDREFKETEAEKARNFEKTLADLDKQFRTLEAEKGRLFTSEESSKGRLFTSEENEKTRGLKEKEIKIREQDLAERRANRSLAQERADRAEQRDIARLESEQRRTALAEDNARRESFRSQFGFDPGPMMGPTVSNLPSVVSGNDLGIPNSMPTPTPYQQSQLDEAATQKQIREKQLEEMNKTPEQQINEKMLAQVRSNPENLTPQEIITTFRNYPDESIVGSVGMAQDKMRLAVKESRKKYDSLDLQDLITSFGDDAVKEQSRSFSWKPNKETGKLDIIEDKAWMPEVDKGFEKILQKLPSSANQNNVGEYLNNVESINNIKRKLGHDPVIPNVKYLYNSSGKPIILLDTKKSYTTGSMEEYEDVLNKIRAHMKTSTEAYQPPERTGPMPLYF